MTFSLLFLVAVFSVITPLLPDITIAADVRIDRSALWSLGFGPVSIVLGLGLMFATISAWQGWSFGRSVCIWWGPVHALSMGALLCWHFPSAALATVPVALVWAFLWHRWLARTFSG